MSKVQKPYEHMARCSFSRASREGEDFDFRSCITWLSIVDLPMVLT
jgi:hypothetical protein